MFKIIYFSRRIYNLERYSPKNPALITQFKEQIVLLIHELQIDFDELLKFETDLGDNDGETRLEVKNLISNKLIVNEMHMNDIQINILLNASELVN